MLEDTLGFACSPLLSFVNMKIHLQVNGKNVFHMGKGTLHLHNIKGIFLPAEMEQKGLDASVAVSVLELGNPECYLFV